MLISTQPIRHLLWHGKVVASFLGSAGIIGLAFLLLGALIADARVSRFTHEVDLLQQTKPLVADVSLSSKQAVASLDLYHRLSTFYGSFAGDIGMPDQMAKIFSVASVHGVSLDEGDYRLTKERDAKLNRYEVTIPLKGTYLQIRKFIAESLVAVPPLALDEITFGRQKAGDATLEARLRFTLYTRSEP